VQIDLHWAEFAAYPTCRANLVPRSRLRGEPCRPCHAGCLSSFGPKPNPFSEGRQVKSERGSGEERILSVCGEDQAPYPSWASAASMWITLAADLSA